MKIAPRSVHIFGRSRARLLVVDAFEHDRLAVAAGRVDFRDRGRRGITIVAFTPARVAA